jgi:hypothetical protein
VDHFPGVGWLSFRAAPPLLELLRPQTSPAGCGLYALWPGPKARAGRSEERTTSHAQLYYGAIGAALLATQNSTSELARALEDWLYHDMSWCHHCYTPFGVVAAGCRVNMNDGTFAPHNGNRDEIYWMLAGLSGRAPKITHRSQLGVFAVQKLLDAKDSRLVHVAERLRAGELATPRFWYGLEVGVTRQAMWTWCPTMPASKMNVVGTYAPRDGAGEVLRLSKEELAAQLEGLEFERHLVFPGFEERKGNIHG